MRMSFSEWAGGSTPVRPQALALTQQMTTGTGSSEVASDYGPWNPVPRLPFS